MNTNVSIIDLKGVGEKTRKLYEKLNIHTVHDLIYHLPRDYEAFEEPCLIEKACPGNKCAVYATVQAIPNQKRIRNLTIINILIKDMSGAMQLTFFNMPFLTKVLKPGMRYVFRGNVQSRGNAKIMEQPQMFSYEEYAKQIHVLMPKYALTKGLTNHTLQKNVLYALNQYDLGEDIYPESFLDLFNLISLKNALKKIHFPENPEEIKEARKRLVFDEFFAFIYMLKKSKDQSGFLTNKYQMFETADTVRFLESLPFCLTKGQKKVWQEIRNDLAGDYCMNRLVQGDVGSGKTIVAVLALLQTVANGFQGALMAPTEVLAVQHYENIVEYTKQYNLCFKPVLLVGSMTAKEKKAAYEVIASGDANLIIGTHAIIQDKVIFKNLALVVTDEQHRFGVRQREKLSDKGMDPHVLVMSATPIPRTLAIILYGDLHISIIDELPANRLPIKNCVVNTAYRPKAYSFIEKQIALGKQAYVICPMVEEGEMDDLENVIEYTEKIRASVNSDIQIAYLHGKMPSSKKNQIMNDFANKNIDILVSTTVIEVGINVPNATVMMIENAERFGLAQLHQLRGRVGRGDDQSYCIFISTNESKDTMERLNILNKSNDGFFIASEDLKLRGPGDIFGVRQSGEFGFQIGDVYTDADVLKAAGEAVDYYLEHIDEININNEYINRNFIDFRSI